MNGGKQPLGYTIVEVMIVLAVSGTMFLIASTFIGGKQARTAFTQGTNELASRIQDTIEQVTDGQYSDIDITCSYSGVSTNPNLPVSSTPTGQGTQNDCVFLGKLMHFSVNGSPNAYEVLSVAGGRISNNQPVTDLSAADPKVIRSLTVNQNIPQQLDVTKIIVADDEGGGDFQSYIFGFFQGQGSPSGTGGLSNGSQALSLYYVSGAGSNIPTTAAQNKVYKNFLVRAKKVQLCVSDGTRWAVISLGNNDSTQGNTTSQLIVDTQTYGNNRPAIC